VKKEGMTPRKIKGRETRRKLYESAESLFEQRGFEDVSVDDIVEAAGVSKGTFYVHFESKDALIVALAIDYVGKADTNYQAHLDALPADAPAADALLSLIGKIADVLTGVIGHNRMRNLYKVQLTRTVDIEIVMGYNRRLYGLFGDVLSRGVRRGEFKTGMPIDTLAQHFVMAMRGLTYEWCARFPDFDLKEQALMHFSILLEGIWNGG